MRRLLFALVAALSLAAPAATAAEPQPFTQAAFASAQAEGKAILVEVAAPWCPTCAKQRPILAELEHSPEFADLAVFTVDFDTQKDVLRALRVQQQSTLIVFKGTAEKGRSTGVTDPAAIKALLMRTKSA